MNSSPFLVKLFIEADTKEGLVLAQVRNNLLGGQRFIYDPPIKDGNKWVAWYFGMVDERAIMIEAMEKISGDR